MTCPSRSTQNWADPPPARTSSTALVSKAGSIPTRDGGHSSHFMPGTRPIYGLVLAIRYGSASSAKIPPWTGRAWKPVWLPLIVSYRSLNGTRLGVVLAYV